MKLSKKTKELFKAIDEKDKSHAGAKEHLDSTNSILRNYYNSKIKTQAKEEFPEISLSEKLSKQFKYAAKKTSQFFGKACEIAGVCTGKVEDKIEIDDYHIYKDQKCNSTKYFIPAEGRLHTKYELKKRELELICDAHSHNIMGCFHSNEDDNSLVRETSWRTRQFQVDVNGNKLDVYYRLNIVFNEKDKPHVEVGLEYPKLTKEGVSTEIETFKYEGYATHRGKIRFSDLRRIKREIESRVSYSTQ